MLVFGINIPLVEVILTFVVIIFILLVEAAVIILLLVKQIKRTQKLTDLINNMASALLDIKSKEIEAIEKLKR